MFLFLKKRVDILSCFFRIMSQQRTRGNPNFGKDAIAPTLAVNNSTLAAYAPNFD